jgi:hypothetical protein
MKQMNGSGKRRMLTMSKMTYNYYKSVIRSMLKAKPCMAMAYKAVVMECADDLDLQRNGIGLRYELYPRPYMKIYYCGGDAAKIYLKSSYEDDCLLIRQKMKEMIKNELQIT